MDGIWVIAALTMILGNVIAVAQSNVKRMLAYSTIAHAGYLLVALLAANDLGKGALLFYLLSYAVTNLGAFGVIALLDTAEWPNDQVRDYAGLWNEHPALAGLMTVFLLSLGGFPPMAGFIAKWYVFSAAVKAGYYWLAILGVLTSVVSVFFYLRIVVMMYMTTTESPARVLPVPKFGRHRSAILVLGILGCSIGRVSPRFSRADARRSRRRRGRTPRKQCYPYAGCHEWPQILHELDRSNGSGRMPTFPNSRPRRSLPRSIRICTRRSSGAAPAVFDHAGLSHARSARFPPGARTGSSLRRIPADRIRSGASPSRAVLVERCGEAARSLRDRRTLRRHRRAHRRSADSLRARAVAAARLVSDPPVADRARARRPIDQSICSGSKAELKRLEAEYNMYFAGRLPKPPCTRREGAWKRSSNSTIAPTSRITANGSASRRCRRGS